MTFSTPLLLEALSALGEVLAERGIAEEIVVIGGGGLHLLGLIRRPTADVDVLARIVHGDWILARPLPPAVTLAVAEVAVGFDLASDWLNAGPTDQLRAGLPEGFRSRLHTRTFHTLTVHVASRHDQVALKLFAAADRWPAPRNKHLDDLRTLAPTQDELRDAEAWCLTQDGDAFATEQLAPVLHALRWGPS